jgi:predicted O-methyltransferase YrrM
LDTQLTFGAAVDALLDRLYEQNASQDAALGEYFSARAAEGSLDWNGFDERTNVFLRDKLIALDRLKAEFCYSVCRAMHATRVVEAGTSFGVSTIYLALAVRDNLRAARASRVDGPEPIVIATEHEPEKAKRARAHFEEAGVSHLIDLREGDLRDTLREYMPSPIDFMLIDIWTPVARPALSLMAPQLRDGAVVICDNTEQFRDAYADYFDFIRDARMQTLTLPFPGGLEFTVRV